MYLPDLLIDLKEFGTKIMLFGRIICSVNFLNSVEIVTYHKVWGKNSINKESLYFASITTVILSIFRI